MTQTIGIVQKFHETQAPIAPEQKETDELLQIADIINSAHGELSLLIDHYPAQSNWDTDAVWTNQWLVANSESIQARLEAKLSGEEFSLGDIEAQVTSLEEAISATRLLAYAPSQRHRRETEPIQLVPEQIGLLRTQFEFLRSVYRATHDNKCEIGELSPKAEWYEVRAVAEREGVEPLRMDVPKGYQDDIHIAYWDYVNKPTIFYNPSNPLFKDWMAIAHPDMTETDVTKRFTHLYGEWFDSPHYRKNVSEVGDRARKNILALADKLGVPPKQAIDMFSGDLWLRDTLISISEQIEGQIGRLNGDDDAVARTLIEQDGLITELERQTRKAYRLTNLPDAIQQARMADITDKLQDIIAALLLERAQAVDLGRDTSEIDTQLDRFSRTGAFLPYIVQPTGTEPNPTEVAQAYIDSLQSALTSKHLSRIAATALATAA